ncbi:hypothetical protein RRG08_059438 [Elysia crispata]|uniref:Uncharacterized protein n=1 Tax=Elysia crispata TaxID=231223 RepID=A0AAE1DS27_9GAST|nr:hypothetical protein RRG08_059438 [Elysia crispata]
MLFCPLQLAVLDICGAWTDNQVQAKSFWEAECRLEEDVVLLNLLQAEVLWAFMSRRTSERGCGHKSAAQTTDNALMSAMSSIE